VNNRLYSTQERDLVHDWASKLLELIELINNVTGLDEPPWSPPPPTEIEELRYLDLHFWFLSHQEQFASLWDDFIANQPGACSQNNNNPDDFPEKYLKNPFLYFYEPENLYEMAKQSYLQSGTEIWEPSEQAARLLRPLLIKMGKKMIEFGDWMDRRS